MSHTFAAIFQACMCVILIFCSYCSAFVTPFNFSNVYVMLPCVRLFIFVYRGYFCARVYSSMTSPAPAARRRVEWEISSTQKAVYRTNCIDCLDRTNVVQSAIAKKILEKQLQELAGVSPGEKLPQLEHMFRNVWANNAGNNNNNEGL